MKSILYSLIISLICIFPTTGHTQSNYLANQPLWTVSSSCAAPFPCVENKFYNYYLNGDSIVGSFTYKKLFIRGIGGFQWFDNPPIPPNCIGSYSFNDTTTAIALIREDAKKMFINVGGVDTLLYDFDLNVGDTLPITYNNFASDIYVFAIDSFLVDTNYRKRFTLLGNTSSYFLLEGIGHDKGLLETLSLAFDCGYNLQCFGLGDTSYYPSLSTTCDIFVGLQEVGKDKHLPSSYPNPCINLSRVQLYDLPSSPCTIRVVNSLGQQIELLKNIQDQHSLDVTTYLSGTYFIEIQSEKGIQVIKQIIVRD
jgi:hypothetical protein